MNVLVDSDDDRGGLVSPGTFAVACLAVAEVPVCLHLVVAMESDTFRQSFFHATNDDWLLCS